MTNTEKNRGNTRKHLDAGVRNILRVWARATEDERVDGATWYARAHAIARSHSDDTGHELTTCAAVLSAISPNNSWGTNVAQAREMLWSTSDDELTAVSVSTYDAGLKARKILRGELLAECGKTTQRRTHAFCHGRAYSRAPKTSAFFRLIRDGGNDYDVCVDGHAYNIYAGVGRTLKDAGSLNAGQYREAAEAYRAAAEIAGVPPHVMQATTWLAQRRILDRAARHNDPQNA